MTTYEPLTMQDLRIGDLFLTDCEGWDEPDLFFVLDSIWDGVFIIVKLVSFKESALAFEEHIAMMTDKLEERAVLVSRRPNAGVNYAVA